MNNLNEKQKEAVLHTEGPLLIVAGAGAGKTKTLTSRIIHLIKKGIEPENILAVTFTNKAAKEMKERVGNNTVNIYTLHSLGLRIIKENAQLLKLNRFFNITDSQDSLSLIKKIMKENDINPKQFEPRTIKSFISKNKSDFKNVNEFKSNSSIQSVVSIVWPKYEKTLKKEGSLDFDDLIVKTVELLKKNKSVREKYQKLFKYIHVDEYQDTNEAQYKLLKLITTKNICVVGDTDQNIYSWRGANIKNMLHFEKDYPKAKIVILEQNYRSTKNILEAAGEIIKKNNFRIDKTLFTENSEGEKITLYEGYDEMYEANFVAEKIEEILEEYEPEQIAVLYRTNFQSRVLEESLLSKQISYQVLGVKFFERKEIKNILSYLKASLNKDNLSDIRRIINVPTRGIGKVTIAKLFSNSELSPNIQDKIDNFYQILDDIKKYTKKHTPSEIIKFILQKSGLEESLSKGSGDDLEKLDNIKELVSLATKYDDIEKLLEDASLSSDQDNLEKGKGVKLMTIHAAKGLEFKYVFITGLEQDLFPHSRIKKEESEEERRLFYVALTRAEKKLFLSYTSLRTVFGTKQVNEVSEFIADIPEHLLEYQTDVSSEGKVIYI
ncbi:MAG: UvrD-helicase domain-containing protein [Patescibacteria group bacterium]|nr:UvrD-helicase domain-containing protein [Patescibacteria group bacterium]